MHPFKTTPMNHIHIAIQQFKTKEPKICRPVQYSMQSCTRVDMSMHINMDAVMQVILSVYPITIDQLRERTRKRQIVKVRQIAAYLLKKYCKESLETIGEYLGGQDHTTVLYSIDTVKDLKHTNEDYSHEVTLLEHKIQAYQPN